MADDRWSTVDRYVADTIAPDDAVLRAAQDAAVAAGLPGIEVTAAQGKLLHLLARSIGAQAILEVGTLAGYSTIWLARALAPGGRLVTLEAEPRHAEVARANLEHAGLTDVVELREGPASETLAQLVAERAGPFDLVFVDADKPQTPDYVEWGLALARPGALIVADNVVRDGAVGDPGTRDPGARGSRRLHELLTDHPRLSATTIQTVGAKGYDGFTLALVTA